MLSNVGAGWCDFDLFGFHGRCSYLTDPVYEIAHMFLNGCGVVTIDEEDSEFDIVLTPGKDLYIVSRKGEHVLYCPDKWVPERNIVKEFVDDVKRDIDQWIVWDKTLEDEFDAAMRRRNILMKIDELEDKYKL